MTNQRRVLWSRDLRSTNHSSPDEEVGGLEVAVHDVAGVEVSHAAQQLQHVAPAHTTVSVRAVNGTFSQCLLRPPPC